MLVSRLTSKGQATIPAEVRARLDLRAGDSVLFEIKKDAVRLRKARPLDVAFLALSAEAFADWSTPEADEAFRDL